MGNVSSASRFLDRGGALVANEHDERIVGAVLLYDAMLLLAKSVASTVPARSQPMM